MNLLKIATFAGTGVVVAVIGLGVALSSDKSKEEEVPVVDDVVSETPVEKVVKKSYSNITIREGSSAKKIEDAQFQLIKFEGEEAEKGWEELAKAHLKRNNQNNPAQEEIEAKIENLKEFCHKTLTENFSSVTETYKSLIVKCTKPETFQNRAKRLGIELLEEKEDDESWKNRFESKKNEFKTTIEQMNVEGGNLDSSDDWKKLQKWCTNNFDVLETQNVDLYWNKFLQFCMKEDDKIEQESGKVYWTN